MDTVYDALQAAHDPAVLNVTGASDVAVPGASGEQAAAPGLYPEIAARAEVVRRAIEDSGLGPIVAPAAHDLSTVRRVHGRPLLEFLERAFAAADPRHRHRGLVPETYPLDVIAPRAPSATRGGLGLHSFDTSSPILAGTWNAACAAARVALTAATRVAGGERAAFALCRPPGHHASRSRYGGFCYLNNAAVAAEWLATQTARVAVLDVDYHHGNGTQDVFYARDDVFVCSLHADPDREFPFFWGYADETGSGAGAGANLNLPLPAGTGEGRYLEALGVALHAIRDHAADVLVLSLGVDTYRDDPLGTFELATESFIRIGARVGALGLPTVVVLEGGYDITTLGANVVAFLRGLLGEA